MIPFPKTEQEAMAWEPTIRYHALASRVLAVATTRVEGKWRAYCDAVPGKSHQDEWGEVLAHGCYLHEEVARAIFPCFADIPYARR